MPGIADIKTMTETVRARDRRGRFAGRSRYSSGRMVRFALDAITSFSTMPLRAAVWLGLLAVAAGFAILLYVFYRRLVAGATVPGWASIVSLLAVFNGITLLLLGVLGVLGEYVGRIYEEVKRRPLYVVRERLGVRAEPPPENPRDE
jgi:dolichol-phosphate mannosyltransferase